jgi:hypothetical protein
MADENENKKPTYLDELRAEKAEILKEKADLIRVKDEAQSVVNSLEQFKQEQILSGATITGQPEKKKTPEEIKKEGALSFFKDTALEKAIDKYHG